MLAKEKYKMGLISNGNIPISYINYVAVSSSENVHKLEP
jgi:hypothetical protein